MLQIIYKYQNKERYKEFNTKKEVKKYIENISNRNKHNELGFFLYSGEDRNNKVLIGYLEYNYGKWENCEFFKRGSELNNPGDIFNWNEEYIKDDEEDLEEI